MSYGQHMRHWKNHRKDRYFQQCSGYGGDGVSHQLTEEQLRQIEVDSFNKLLCELKHSQEFPTYIASNGGMYHVVSERNLFGHRIESYDELVKFGDKYVFYKE